MKTIRDFIKAEIIDKDDISTIFNITLRKYVFTNENENSKIEDFYDKEIIKITGTGDEFENIEIWIN